MSARGSGAQGSAGRAGPGPASAALGARAPSAAVGGAGSGRSRAGCGVQAWVRARGRAGPDAERPDFPPRTFRSHPRRRPGPGFLARRAAKIAQGRISTSARPDRAGQLGSSRRPTAEGPASRRARGPGPSPGPSALPPPPGRVPPRPPRVGGAPSRNSGSGGGTPRIVPVAAVVSGGGILSPPVAGAGKLAAGAGPPSRSAASVSPLCKSRNCRDLGAAPRTPPTLRLVARRSGGGGRGGVPGNRPSIGRRDRPRCSRRWGRA